MKNAKSKKQNLIKKISTILCALLPFMAFAQTEMSIGAARGIYMDLDADTYRYSAVSAKFISQFHNHLTAGVKFDWDDQMGYLLFENASHRWSITPLLGIRYRFLAGEIGPAMVFGSGLWPALYLRLGPEDIIYASGSFLDESPPLNGGMYFRAGVGTGELAFYGPKLWLGVGLIPSWALIGKIEQRIVGKLSVTVSGNFFMSNGFALVAKYSF